MEDTLNHYGVPGMKWGVRKDRNRVKKGTTKKARTPEERRALGKKRAKIVLGVAGAVTLAAAAVTIAAYKKKYAPSTIGAGTVFQNVNIGGNLSTKRPFYATHLGKDREIYLKKFTEELIKDTGRTDIYANRVINKKSLKIPSPAKAQALYREFTKNPKADLSTWHRLSSVTSGNGSSRPFVDYLREQGFDGLPDTYDKGYIGIGVKRNLRDGAQNPVYLFPDPDNYVSIGRSLVNDILKKV